MVEGSSTTNYDQEKMSRTNFENLRVYKLAEELADEIWKIVHRLGHFCSGHSRPANREVCRQHWCEHCRRNGTFQFPGQSALCENRARFVERNATLPSARIQA